MVSSTCPSMRIPLLTLPTGSATCSMTCWPRSAVPMVKRRGTLRALSSRTRPARRNFPPLILFIDLLLFKLETSQVVEYIFWLSSTYRSTFPSPTTHGQRRPSNALPSPDTIIADAGFPPSHTPRAHHHADVMPFLMCSGLMVVGHRLDCYSLLSVVFAVFHGHPVTAPSHRTSSLSSRSSSRCACLQLGLSLWYPARQDITFRRQFAISFSHRSECFFIALHCFRVSSSCPPGSLLWGSRPCVPKGVEGKVEEDIFALISCILTHLHPYPQYPHSTPPTLAYSTSRLLAHQSSSTRLRIAYLRCSRATVAISAVLDHTTFLAGPTPSATP
jgi:hypothetical protein